MMVVAWLVFPVVLSALALGCGLLLERVSRVRLDGVLILPAGVAMIVVSRRSQRRPMPPPAWRRP